MPQTQAVIPHSRNDRRTDTAPETREQVVQPNETRDRQATPTQPGTSRKFAVPTANGRLAMHFGHCAEFVFVISNGPAEESWQVEMKSAPEHQPGLLPRWLAEHEADTILAGGMGSRARQLFAAQGITVITGAPALPPKELVKRYLAGTLETGDNVCDH